MGDIFTDKDKGWKSMLAQMKVSAGESHVLIGYLRSSGTYKDDQSKDKDAGDNGKAQAAAPITMAQLASIHEFGATIKNGFGRGIKITIPERSFMRSTMNTRAGDLTKLVKRVSNSVISGKITRKQALGIIGQKVVDWIKGAIDEGIPPPNKSSTVKAKGSSHALIDTGQLRNSLDYEVRDKESK